MDFITHLPTTTNGFDCITSYVDCFTKRVNFLPSKARDSAEGVGRKFFGDIFRLHGLPDSIVSERDSRFTAHFWAQLMNCCGTHLKMATTKHPQTDGATEIINRMMENYLRCYCSHRQSDCEEHLPSAEFAYNSSTLQSLGTSPFELDLGWCPRSPIEALASQLESTVQSFSDLKHRLRHSFEDAQFDFKLVQDRQATYKTRNMCLPSTPLVTLSFWVVALSPTLLPPCSYPESSASNNTALSKWLNWSAAMQYVFNSPGLSRFTQWYT